jgi:hypothetical protein
MIASLPNMIEQRSGGRTMVRPSLGRARSWTGRSAVAWATDSQLSRLKTAGTRVTRVSALRLAHVALPLRRMDSGPPITSG